MGHERVGILPHTKRWRDVVAQLAESPESREDIAVIANATLQNVRLQFRQIHTDEGVIAAFQFLIALTKNASSGELATSSLSPTINFGEQPSTLRLIGELCSWVEAQSASHEYAVIATKAAGDAISLWSSQQAMQPSLFSSSMDSQAIWERANNGAGFCEVSRLFFSKFTERYLNYFLEREASASMTSVTTRDELSSQLREHIDGVSRFAFETSRITQSFAAGWFNTHAQENIPSVEESRGFLYIAFGKLREELLREAGHHG